MDAREPTNVQNLEITEKEATLEKEMDAKKRAAEHEAEATSAVKEKEKLEKENDRLQGEIEDLKQRLANSMQFCDELELKNQDAEVNISKLEETILEAENKAVRLHHVVEHLKGEISDLKSEVDNRGMTIATLTEQLAATENGTHSRTSQLGMVTVKVETVDEEDAAFDTNAQLRDQLDDANTELDRTKVLLDSTFKELRNTINDGNKLHTEVRELRKQLIQHIRNCHRLEKSKASFETERERLRNQVTVMERDLMLCMRQAEMDEIEIENLKRERDALLTKNRQLMPVQYLEDPRLGWQQPDLKEGVKCRA